MQQTISINIVDPGNLPQLGAVGNFFTDNPLIFVALGLVLVAGTIAYYSHKRAILLRGGGTALSATKFRYRFILPLLILIPLTWSLGSVAEPVEAAAGTPSVDRVDSVSIDIPQGETSGSATFSFDVTGFTDGFDLSAQIDALNSQVPSGVIITVDGVNISVSASAIVHEWRQTVPDTSQLTVTATVPADASIGESYALAVLSYTAINKAYYYTFQDPGAVGLTDPYAVHFDPTPGTGTCDANMQIYGAVGTLPDTVDVTDTRNGKVYRVRKLATVSTGGAGTGPNTTTGGKCWMIDNLALGKYNLTSADSNVAVAFTIGGEVHDATSHANGVCVGGTVTASGAYLTCDGSSSLSGGNSRYSAYTDVTSSNANYGYLYNYFTASAGTVDNNVTTGNAANDICPKGWHLPSGGWASNTEFRDLDRAYGGTGSGQYSTPMQLATLWLPDGAFDGSLSGTYSDVFSNQGTYSNWWSNKVDSDFNSNILDVYATYVNPGTNYNAKYYGFAIRCTL